VASPADLDRVLGRFSATGGRLDAEIWENSLASLPPQLTYNVVVTGAPIEDGGVVAAPELTLEQLALEGKSWRVLAGCRYEFPRPHSIVVQDGEEYQVGGTGWLAFAEQSYWLKPLLLELGDSREESLDMTLRALVMPSSMPEERENEGRELVVATRLQVGPVTVVGDLEALEEPTLEEAAALAGRLLDPEDYGEPVREDDAIRIHPRIRPSRSVERAG
jgi:hypothetical protein